MSGERQVDLDAPTDVLERFIRDTWPAQDPQPTDIGILHPKDKTWLVLRVVPDLPVPGMPENAVLRMKGDQLLLMRSHQTRFLVLAMLLEDVHNAATISSTRWGEELTE